MLYAYTALIFVIVIGVPTALFLLLLYHGVKLDIQQRKKPPRGFEVVSGTRKAMALEEETKE